MPKRKQPDPEEFRQEAARLSLLPAADQHEIIALHRSVASNPKVSKREREAGKARADALERFLGLAKKRRKK